MPARLTIHFSDQPARTWIAEQDGEYLLGRDPRCEVVLDDARVSRRHARLTLTGTGGSIADLESKNGLAVDGRQVEEAWLPDSCWLSVGGLLTHFERGDHVLDADGEAARRRRETLDGHRPLAEPGLDVATVVQRLLRSFLDMSGADRGFVLLGGARDRFEIVASEALTPEAAALDEFAGSVSTVEQVLAEGAPVVRSDASAGELASIKPSIVREGIRALVCVPLTAAGRTVGAVYGDSRRPGKTFRELDLEILGALASHAALALWAAGLRDELEGLAGELPTRGTESSPALSPLPGFPTWSGKAAENRAGERP